MDTIFKCKVCGHDFYRKRSEKVCPSCKKERQKNRKYLQWYEFMEVSVEEYQHPEKHEDGKQPAYIPD